MNLSKASFSLETKRLSLRVLDSFAVTEAYVSWLNNPEINKYLEARWTVHSFDSVSSQVDSIYESSNDALFGICTRPQSAMHIGNVKLSAIDPMHRTAEIGFLIGEKDYWGQGLASEAIGRVCDWAFSDLGLRKITAGAYAVNLGSIKALEKVGFQREGVLKDQVQLTPNTRCDVYRFGLIVSD